MKCYTSKDLTTPTTPFPSNHLRHAHNQTNAHHHASKRYTYIRHPSLPRPPFRQFHKTKRRENVRQRARRGGADELENDAQIAGDERGRHGGEDERGGENEVSIRIVRFAWEVVLGHDLATDEALEGKSRDHV